MSTRDPPRLGARTRKVHGTGRDASGWKLHPDQRFRHPAGLGPDDRCYLKHVHALVPFLEGLSNLEGLSKPPAFRFDFDFGEARYGRYIFGVPDLGRLASSPLRSLDFGRPATPAAGGHRSPAVPLRYTCSAFAHR
jgi:hypothetical protein